jgi:broad specificity phosphatase PhoE
MPTLTPARGEQARGEIVLVRHGRSAHVDRRWLTADGVREWMRAYDAADITPADPPRPELLELAARCDVLVASDLPRAVASAVRLAPSADQVVTSPLLREAPLETATLPLPRLLGARLPLGAWALVLGGRWLGAAMRGAPPPGVDDAVLARAEEAARWLAALATPGTRVLAVTHTTFRTVLSAALVRQRWQGPARRPVRTWSAWRHVAPEG